MTTRHIALFALAAFAIAAGGIVHAKDRDHDQDAASLAGMKVTLTQAIATAEQQAGGRAVSADMSQEHGPARIAVEVVGPQGVKTLLVDAQSGQIAATQDGDQDGEEND